MIQIAYLVTVLMCPTHASPRMEIDLYVPSFRAMSKRMRSHSPTRCERPLVCVFVFSFHSRSTFNFCRSAYQLQCSSSVTLRATRHCPSNPPIPPVLHHLRVCTRSPIPCLFKSTRSQSLCPLQRTRVSRMSSGSPSRATLPSFLLNVALCTRLLEVATRPRKI